MLSINNLVNIRSRHFLPIFYQLFTCNVGDLKSFFRGHIRVNMNTFSVCRVHCKTLMLVLSAGFCRRVADWLIYNTFMLNPDKVNL